ncbi:alpha-1,2-fucosyltransferase [Pelagibacteraceae bacterium]|nr:alpha-1,2-fucosyltransferase [Pelagibacteraceae bacterium]
MKKVIVRLGNGLGNQLFTYAAAYSFAKKNDAILYVDDESGFYIRHKYELHNFNISAPIVEKKDKFLGFMGRTKRKILIKLSNFNTNTKFLIEKKDQNKLSNYNLEQFDINFTKNLYFEGYFQSEKYYKLYIQGILKEFTFKNNIIEQKNSFINDIKNSNSVSIHLRQDKFLADENHKNLDQLNSEFMKNNISLIKRGIEYFDKKIDNPKYFVWSNNFSGIKTLFESKKFTLVNENFEKDPAYDLYLMSLCKHFILSASSMHYWGALLSKNLNKICLSPPYIKNRSGYYGFSNNKDIRADWWKEI